MTTINWKVLKEFSINGAITIPWMLVLDEPRESTHLQIKARGRWTPSGGLLAECGPDGLLGLPFQTDRLSVADCPVGALIGKFGGSSASLTPPSTNPPEDPKETKSTLTEGRSFAIGSHCVIAIPTGSIGPLFVSFNGLIRPVQVAELNMTVSGATPTT